MRVFPALFFVVALLVAVGCITRWSTSPEPPAPVEPPATSEEAALVPTAVAMDETETLEAARVEPPRESLDMAPFVEKGLQWLVASQHESGGWGAGSHSRQNIRDPHAVQTDPATTAFTTMALLRTGHTPTSGEHRDVVRRAVQHLVTAVENAPADGPRITDLKGTQPQTKLGGLVDTSMTLQCLSRVLRLLPKEDELYSRVDTAVDRCLAKVQGSQTEEGNWGAGGWAGVLQSSLNTQALESAQVSDKVVSAEVLDRARLHLKGNYDPGSGRATARDGAGVELYSFAGAQRAAASEARAATDALEEAKKRGDLALDAEPSAENLRVAGIAPARARTFAESHAQVTSQIARLDDETMLSGFGSNGGEEYLSYMLTSESLVLANEDEWQKWSDKLHARLQKIQSPDGSWTGHHCITSPVFCTAAVVQCLTADHDREWLEEIAAKDLDENANK